MDHWHSKGGDTVKYLGSKARIAKYIVPIIQSYINNNQIEVYIEPFAGGMNVIDKIDCKYKIANDNNPYLIAMFKQLVETPDLLESHTVCSKERYVAVRESYKNHDGKYPDWYIGYIGFLASQNGRFFDGGYAKPTAERNYFDEARRNLIKQVPYLNNVNFQCSDYRGCRLDRQAVIYCDPPYKNVKSYTTSRNFDYECFYEWCRTMSQEYILLVSESEMPDDFEAIWTGNLSTSVSNCSTTTRVEKLWKYKGGIA